DGHRGARAKRRLRLETDGTRPCAPLSGQAGGVSIAPLRADDVQQAPPGAARFGPGTRARPRPPDLTSGADGAADVGEDLIDLLPQRGEDEQHHNGDQHEDQGVLDHALSLLTTGEPAVQRTARHLSKAEVRRGDPGQEFSGPIPRIHAPSVTSKSARNPNSM